jgi:hypothetical protein
MLKLTELHGSRPEGGDMHPSDAGAGTATESQRYESTSPHIWSPLQDLGVSSEVLAAVIDTFFRCFHNQPYSFFHEQSLRRRVAEQTAPVHTVLAVMATAVRFCTHPYYAGRAYEAAVGYATKAWRYIVSECFDTGRAAEISTVQTIALLGLFDFTG